jgi:hypothetical protein
MKNVMNNANFIRNNLERRYQAILVLKKSGNFDQHLVEYFDYIGRNEELSNIIISLVQNDIISGKELYDLYFNFFLGNIREASEKIPVPLFLTKKLNKKHNILNKFEVFIIQEQKDSKQDIKNGIPLVDPSFFDEEREEDAFSFITRIHNLIINQLENLQNNDTNNIVDFDGRNLVLYGKTINFSKKANQRDLLRTLFNDKTKKWYYDEVAEDWDNMTDILELQKEKSWWLKFRTASYEINKYIASKTGIEDFLLMDSNAKGGVEINPEYLDKT